MSRRDPIAIVGMSCLFPGSSRLDSFWQGMLAGTSLYLRDVLEDIAGITPHSIARTAAAPIRPMPGKFLALTISAPLALSSTACRRDAPTLWILSSAYSWIKRALRSMTRATVAALYPRLRECTLALPARNTRTW